MFDKKAWMTEYIESKTVRDHMACAGLSFSDAEMATITFHSGKPPQALHRTLEELAEATEDQELKEQIRECVAYDLHCLELFETNDGSCFYMQKLQRAVTVPQPRQGGQDAECIPTLGRKAGARRVSRRTCRSGMRVQILGSTD